MDQSDPVSTTVHELVKTQNSYSRWTGHRGPDSWQTNGATPRLLFDGNYLYLYGPDGTTFERIDFSGNPQSLHQDQLGSTRVVTDVDNNVITTGSYDPQGQITSGYTAPVGYASRGCSRSSGRKDP